MPLDGALPWHDSTDPEEREALAALVLSEMQSLAEHHGWKRLMHEVGRRSRIEIEGLVASDKDDDRRRGIIATLKTIEEMPVKVAQAASVELANYRGN